MADEREWDSDTWSRIVQHATETFRNGTPAIILPASVSVEWLNENECRFELPNADTMVLTSTPTSINHILDIHYPHKCHKCDKDLYWVELYKTNAIVAWKGSGDNCLRWDFEAYKRLKKLWRSKFVQFFCCECYRDMEIRNED